MRTLPKAQAIFVNLASRIARLGEPKFTCGDCERWERCGAPPHDCCLARAAQIARDGGRSAQRLPAFPW